MILLSILSLSGFALALQHRWQFTSVLALMLSVSCWTLAVFAAGLLGLLGPVAWLLWLVGLALFLLLGLPFMSVGRVSARHLLSLPYPVLAVSCLAFWLVHHDSFYFFYDEFSHWGVYIREMWALDRLWGIDTNSVRPRYLPGTALWQYAFTIPSPNLESASYLAQFVLVLLPVLVLVDRLPPRQWPWLLPLVGLVIAGLLDFGHGVTSLYVDHVIGAWIFGIAMLGFRLVTSSGRRADWVAIALLLAFLALIKAIAVLFILALVAIGLVLYLARGFGMKEEGNLAGLWRGSGVALLVLLPSMLAIVAWQIDRDRIGAHAYSLPACLESCRQDQLDEAEPLGQIFEGLLAEGFTKSEQSRRVLDNFWQVIMIQKLSKDADSRAYNEFRFFQLRPPEHPLGLSTAGFLGLFFMWFAVLAAWLRARSFLLTWGLLALGMLACAVGYIASLLLAYLFFYDHEGADIPSYLRFAHTMVLPLFLLMIAVLVPGVGPSALHQRLQGRHPVTPAGTLVALLLVFMWQVETPYVRSLVQAQPYPRTRMDLQPATQTMRRLLGRQSLLILMADDVLGVQMRDQLLLYLLAPTPTRLVRGDDLLRYNDAQLASELARIDFIWLPEVTPAFDARVGERFAPLGPLRLIGVRHGETVSFFTVESADQLRLHGAPAGR